MTTTLEISLYPLRHDYPDAVIHFIKKLKQVQGFEVQSNGMSTIIIGDFRPVWDQLGVLIENQFEEGDSVFVIKIAPGRREFV